MKTYKGTDKNLCCRGYQYELGKLNEAEGAIRCGGLGFHSCEAPFDVLRYYGLKGGNRFFECEADGAIDRDDNDDSKLASSKLTMKAEVGFPGLLKAQVEYTRKKAESGTSGGYGSNLAGGDGSNLAGGYGSNLAGGDESNLVGGDGSNLAGGNWSNLAGGDGSNLAGGNGSNLAGGNGSNLAGGDESNLAGGNRSNLAGGDESNLAGGDGSVIIGRNGCQAKAGKNSILCLSEWAWIDGEYIPVSVKAAIVDGKTIMPDTWYKLQDGEFVEVEEKE